MSDFLKEIKQCYQSHDHSGFIKTLAKYDYLPGTVLPFKVLDLAFGYRKLDWADYIMDTYRIDNMNDEKDPIITSAAYCGNKQLFEKLITLGANINALNHVKNSAVGVALAFQNYSGIYDLLELGFQMKSYAGGQALRSAAWEGEFEFVRLFVEHGADVNFNGADQVFPYCTTPVQMAASKNHDEIVKYLVDHGADVTIKDKYGNRAYLEAKRNKNKDLMDYLKRLEPPKWHEADKRMAELKKWGLPTEIMKWLGIENRKIELPDTCSSAFVEFETIFDLKRIEWQDRVFIDLVKEIEGYDSTGFLVWIKDQKCLGSLDVEHDNLFIFEGTKWNNFIKKLPIVVNHVLDGTPIDELYK
ncbi:ankyrin repeat domain-containing protein [Ammoniphilus resinae]|uniref:Ankyrin repeat protein n=1 Tax=Ammoniphilus resinae TaxID=861532 RepID=A0ABS4GP35_9BACL|nr:ankyrin repeat domain-containing protein [Ammoniphilus resinae]MBP1932043.1 hypothetical protein [Ammoniphilus resinae]